MCVPPLYKRKSLEKNQLSAFLHRARRAISMAGSLQYKIIWRNEGLVLNWQTIPSNLFVQPRSIYLRFQIFYYKIPLSSGFVYFIAHKHNELLAWYKSCHHHNLDHYRVFCYLTVRQRTVGQQPVDSQLTDFLTTSH